MTKYPGHFLILLVMFTCQAQAQYDHLLHRPYRDRATDLNAFITRCVKDPDTTAVLNSLEQLKEKAQKNNDRELVLEADLIRACYLEARDDVHNNRVIAELNEVIRKAREQRVLQIQARAYKLLGSLYWNEIKDVEMAFQQYLLEDKVLELPTRNGSGSGRFLKPYTRVTLNDCRKKYRISVLQRSGS